MSNAAERLDSETRTRQRERLLSIMQGRFGSEAEQKHRPPDYALEMTRRFVEESPEQDLKEWAFRPSIIRPCMVFQRTRTRGHRSYEDVLILLEEARMHYMISSLEHGIMRVVEIDLSVDEPHVVLAEKVDVDDGVKNAIDYALFHRV